MQNVSGSHSSGSPRHGYAPSNVGTTRGAAEALDNPAACETARLTRADTSADTSQLQAVSARLQFEVAIPGRGRDLDVQ
jgi:hypothetical protein